jgi:hypothetical protein
MRTRSQGAPCGPSLFLYPSAPSSALRWEVRRAQVRAQMRAGMRLARERAEMRRARERADVWRARERARRLRGSRHTSPGPSRKLLVGLLIGLVGALPKSPRHRHCKLLCIFRYGTRPRSRRCPRCRRSTSVRHILFYAFSRSIPTSLKSGFKCNSIRNPIMRSSAANLTPTPSCWGMSFLT